MDPFVGEIRLMPFNFAPRGWAMCDGSLLAISRSTALFALLGTQYGGDGRTTFALPDLRGRAVVGAGQGPGLSAYPQGTRTGTENVTLNTQQLPAHTHSLASTPLVPVSTDSGTATSPAGGFFASLGSQYGDSSGGGNMAATVLNGPSTSAGSSASHPNLMPFLVLNYCIATEGVFPQRQ
jgi:microcystin-dependent protein